MNSLKNDILASVRQKLLDENQHLLVKPAQDLETNVAKSGGSAERAAQIGAAGARLQFVAAVPPSVVAGVIGYLVSSRAVGK